MEREVVIVSGARTAVGAFGGSLKEVSAIKLGSIVIRDAMLRAGLSPEPSKECLECGPDILKGEGPCQLERDYHVWNQSLTPVHVDEVIMGNVLQAGQGQNPARQASIYAGMPKECPAFTLNKVCASGMKAIIAGTQAIKAGDADVILAGGMESMSNAPYALPKARWGYRMDVSSKGDLYDLMVLDGLWEIFYGYHMGNTAENIAKKYNIGREEQDEIGLLSHQRALSAIEKGYFDEEIVPVKIPQKKGDDKIVDKDERPMETSMEKMARLAPAFRKDGTVTAGNASGINDASAAVVLMAREKAREMGIEPFASVRSYASGGIDPAYMGLGPIPATRMALKKAGLTMNDMDLLEINEAFASQAIACMRELDIAKNEVNLNGSGISLGHPIGASGARMIVSAMYEMKRRDLKLGLLTMCIGGGQGCAIVLER
ncbi:MAG: acetyl-CoA C-acetyltransferase [Dehalococcoidia bacterium]